MFNVQIRNIQSNGSTFGLQIIVCVSSALMFLRNSLTLLMEMYSHLIQLIRNPYDACGLIVIL